MSPIKGQFEIADMTLQMGVSCQSRAAISSKISRITGKLQLSGKGATKGRQCHQVRALTVVLEPAAGNAWIGVGDAAFAVDPIASTGLFNALYFGLAAAETADRMLGGDPAAAVDYATDLQRVSVAYTQNVASFYRLERRWAERPFWVRRHGIASAEKPMQLPLTTI